MPAIQKPEKKPHGKSLIEIMADSMRNSVQILASMMTKCRFFGLVGEYAYLGEQIQLVVDALKSDTGVDQPYLDKLSAKLKLLVDSEVNEGRIPWFKIYKDKELFFPSIPAVDPAHMHDTISQLFHLVATMYQMDDSPFVAGTNEQYAFLFQEVPVTESTLAKCGTYYGQYAQAIGNIINSYPDGPRSVAQEKEMMRRIGLVIDGWVDWADNLKATLQPGQILSIAAGFWKIIHSRNSNSSANIIFRMFPEAVIGRLEIFRGNSFRIRKGDGLSSAVYDDSPHLGMVVRSGDDYYFYVKDGASDDGSYGLFGQVISSGLTAFSCIPMDNMEFPCLLSTRYNKQGHPSYHEAVIM